MSFVCWDYMAGHGRAGIESQTLQLRPAEPRPERPGELSDARRVHGRAGMGARGEGLWPADFDQYAEGERDRSRRRVAPDWRAAGDKQGR